MGWTPPLNVVDNDILTSGKWNSDVVDNTKALVFAGINAQTGTTYTLVLADSYNTMVTLDNAAAITLTVPNDSSVAFPVGGIINLMQLGAGQVTVQGAGSVTLNSNGNRFKTNGQYATVGLIKTAANTWVLYGNTAA